MRPCPPSTRSINHTCPSSSPRVIYIRPPIQQGPRWKPCCMQKNNEPCPAHRHKRRVLRFGLFDIQSQY